MQCFRFVLALALAAASKQESDKLSQVNAGAPSRAASKSYAFLIIHIIVEIPPVASPPPPPSVFQDCKMWFFLRVWVPKYDGIRLAG